MIYLITGAPGTGKTAHALALLKSLPQYPDKVVVVGVREYKGQGTYLETLPMDLVGHIEFAFEGYPGTAFLIDECQDYWPTRAAGHIAPESLKFLPKHRHIGQDYILTCQYPGQLDVKLRHIVGRHLHLEKEALGVFVHEAGRCIDNVKDFPPDSKRPRGGISKDTMDMYVSMEGEETQLQKSKPRLPFKLWLILGLIAILLTAGYYFLTREGTLFRPGTIEGQPSQESGGFNPLAPMQNGTEMHPAQKRLREIKHPLQVASGNTDYPELAEVPRIPVSCIAGRGTCKCYDQAVQLIANLGQDRCRALIEGRDPLVSAWALDDTPKRDLYSSPLLQNKKQPSLTTDADARAVSSGLPAAP